MLCYADDADVMMTVLIYWMRGKIKVWHTTSKVSELFASMVYKLHEMPKNIVSYINPIFLSQFWQELFRLVERSYECPQLITLKVMVKLKL